MECLDFLEPNVGYEDKDGKAVCGCCGTYYVVSEGDLAYAEEITKDLYEALILCLQWANDPEMRFGELEPIIRQALSRANKLFEKEE